MRDAEGSNLDIADAKSMAGLNELDALEAARMPFGKKTQSFGMGFGVEVDGGAPGSQQGRQAADVVAMFVRDDDAVEAIQGMSQRGQAAQGFALSQARIHQQARLGSLEQGAIARTARRENAHAKADGSPPKKLQAKKTGRRHHGKSAGRTSMRFESGCEENLSRLADRASGGSPRAGRRRWRQFFEARRIPGPSAGHPRR